MTDIIVIGGGVMGLATAWQLTLRGHRPLVLEQFSRGHAQGASHGRTRNFNNAYDEAHYLDLLVRARDGWESLGTPGGAPLLRLHGLVTHGSVDIASVHTRLRERDIPCEILDAGEAKRRWPGMRFETDVLWSADAGVIRASAALRELERRIVAAGGEVRWETRALSIREEAARVAVTVPDGVLHAETVVITAGAWTSKLRGAQLRRLRVTEETPAHFAPRSDAPWPSFNHHADPARYPAAVYGMPTTDEGVKVGFHGVGDEVDPDDRPHRTTHAETLSDYVREWMPGLDPESAVHLSCTYTSTDDSTFILERHGRLVIGAGFSGHGFKFAPGIGAVLADLVVDPTARADLSPGPTSAPAAR